MPTPPKKNYYQINSIVKAFTIIEILAGQQEFDLAELSRMADLPKTTVHRMVLTLQQLGYISQNQTNSRYALTSKLFEVGWQTMQKKSHVDIAHQVMERLSDLTEETIYFSVLDGVDMVIVDKIESKHALKQSEPIGVRYKSYHSAGGKAILASLPDETLENLFKNHEFQPSARSSQVTRENLLAEIEKIRCDGFALDDEEYMKSIRCIGAAVQDHLGKVIGGVSVSGPISRIKKNAIANLSKMVIQAANSITAQLGGGKGI